MLACRHSSPARSALVRITVPEGSVMLASALLAGCWYCTRVRQFHSRFRTCWFCCLCFVTPFAPAAFLPGEDALNRSVVGRLGFRRQQFLRHSLRCRGAPRLALLQPHCRYTILVNPARCVARTQQLVKTLSHGSSASGLPSRRLRIRMIVCLGYAFAPMQDALAVKRYNSRCRPSEFSATGCCPPVGNIAEALLATAGI